MAAVEVRLGEVFLNDGHGLAMFIDEGAGCGSAAKGLESERTGAGEEVQHARIFHSLAEDGK